MIGMLNCLVVGFTALDAAVGNDLVFTNQPAANAAGGIGVTPQHTVNRGVSWSHPLI